VSVVERHTMMARWSQHVIGAFLAAQTCRQLEALGHANDIPLLALPG